MTDSPDQTESVFAAAVALADPAERTAYLDQACAGNPALRARIDALLRAHDRAGHLLDQTAAAPAASTIDNALPSGQAGTIIAGKYKLLEQIGEGGMGSVWMADQIDPVKRRVAVKLIASERGQSKSILSRFEAERQAIALMDHPNIAKLLDAGAIDQPGAPGTGRPFFVMELVKGVPLTQFCDEHKLSIPDRLHLFMQICSAVQHAHQKGIIHRDLKPTNILVEMHDDHPVPKVIDFGLAKALSGQPLTEHTLFTGFGAVAGTPLYMAPEQARLNAIDIDTRADIYALGVILYELVTGTTPIERATLKQAAFDEVLRLIRESEPPTPSKRLSTTEAKPSVAANRHTEPAKLGRLVRGELDWIVMKALAKERSRRYDTANGFARDIERFLNQEPVLAGPPGTWYRFRKFARRNRGPVLAAAIVLVVLIGGIVSTTVSLLRALRAEHQTQQNLHVALKALDEIYVQVAEERLPRDPQREKEDKQLLKKALDFYQQFAQQNSTDPPVRLEVSRAHRRAGDIQRFVGDHAAAQQAYGMAIVPSQELANEFPGQPEYSYELAVTHNALAEELLQTGQGPAAAEQFRQAIDLLTKLTADYATVAHYRAELARSHHGLGKLHKQLGERSAGEESFRQALEIQSKLADDFPTVPQYRADLAEIHSSIGYWIELGVVYGTSEQISHVSRASELLTKLVADFPGLPLYRYRLASTLAEQATYGGPWGPRIENYEQAINHLTKLANDFPQVPDYRERLASFYGNLGVTYVMMGDWDKYGRYTRKSLDLSSELVAKYPSVTRYEEGLCTELGNMADVLLSQGQHAEARKLLKDAITRGQALHKSYPDNLRFPSFLVPGKYELASIDDALGQSAEGAKLRHEADILLSDTWKRLRARRGPSSAALFCTDAARGLQSNGDAWQKAGNQKEMAQAYEAAIKVLGRAADLDPKNTEFLMRRANLYVQLGQFDKAFTDYSKRIEVEPKNAGFCNDLAWFLATCPAPDPRRAVEAAEKAVALAPKEANYWNTLGRAYESFHQNDKAIAGFSKAIELDPKFDPPWINRAQLQSSLGKFDKAIADYSKVIELEPKNVWVLGNRADTYSQLKQWDKAIADYSKAIKLEPKNVWALSNRGDSYSQLKQFDKAITDYSKAIELDPKNVWRLGHRADTYSQLKQWDKAIADYSKAIKLEPKSAVAWHQRAFLHAQLRQWDKAIADYSKVLALNPKSAVDLNNLAWLLVTCPDSKLHDPLRAVEQAKKAVELTPNEGNHWNTLGVAQYRAGDWKAAIGALEKSDELLKGNALSFNAFFLAMSHWQLGNKDEARKRYDQAVGWMEKNAPQDDELRRFRVEAEEQLKIENRSRAK
jgi:tetratricopeptide (TPR) repeat protein